MGFMNKVYCTRHNRIKAGGLRMTLLERFTYKKENQKFWKKKNVIPGKKFRACIKKNCLRENPVLTYKPKETSIETKYPVFKFIMRD